MDYKNMAKTPDGSERPNYNYLKRRRCALNMQIRLAMQSYDTEMKEKLERELEEINKQIKHIGG